MMNQTIESVDVSIKWPFKWTLVGSSGSGKTNFALNIIKKSRRLFSQKPDRVIIIYKVFQEIYNTFDKYLPTSYYAEEECDLEELTKSNTERLLIICDDLYFSKKLDEISEHFLIKGRHRNTSWIVLTQSIFNQSALKNISRNSTHMTLFKSVRLNEPHILFSQLRPRSSKVLQDIYSDATEKPYGYLDIDLSQTCPDKLRYKTDLFDSVVKVFVIMNDTSFKTMYLVNKSLLDENQNFKLSIRNKDICSDGMNVIVKPIKQRKSKQINNNQESTQFDDNDEEKGKRDENNDNNQGNISHENDKNPFKLENDYNLTSDRDSSDNIDEIAPAHQEPWYLQDFNKSTHSGDSSLKRKNTDSIGNFVKSDKKHLTSDHHSSENSNEIAPTHKEPWYLQDLNKSTDSSLKRKNKSTHSGELRSKRKNTNSTGNFVKRDKKYVRKYRLNKYPKRFKKRNFNDSSMTPSNNQDREYTAQKIENDEYKKENDSDDQSINNHVREKDSNESGENTLIPLIHDQNKLSISQRIENNKRKKIEDEIDDQWMSGLKSRLNERRVQFKRKHDTIGYRVLPNDESKSIIKPTDFKFIDPVTSSELLGKWKSLKELKKKQTSTKRHKPHRSFSIWKEINN